LFKFLSFVIKETISRTTGGTKVGSGTDDASGAAPSNSIWSGLGTIFVAITMAIAGKIV